VLTRKTSVLAGDLSARQHSAGGRTTASTETICAGTRSLAGAPPASKDPFYPPAQIVCGLVPFPRCEEVATGDRVALRDSPHAPSLWRSAATAEQHRAACPTPPHRPCRVGAAHSGGAPPRRSAQEGQVPDGARHTSSREESSMAWN
jgi:hypothetical protein